MYFDNVSLLIIIPKFLKYFIQSVKELNSNLVPEILGSTNVLPSRISNNTDILLRVPEVYKAFLSLSLQQYHGDLLHADRLKATCA